MAHLIELWQNCVTAAEVAGGLLAVGGVYYYGMGWAMRLASRLERKGIRR